MKATAIIGDTNGFKPYAALARAARDQRVDEIEGGGMDEGRVFIHLKPGFCFPDGIAIVHSRSVGSAEDVKDALASAEPCQCAECRFLLARSGIYCL